RARPSSASWRSPSPGWRSFPSTLSGVDGDALFELELAQELVHTGGDLLSPPALPLIVQGVDGVVVVVAARERLRILRFDPGAVVLPPVGDAAAPLVVIRHMHPALADERDVADEPWRREPREIPDDRVLELLRFANREPPVLC